MCNQDVMRLVDEDGTATEASAGGDGGAAPTLRDTAAAVEESTAAELDALGTALRRCRGQVTDLTHTFDVNFPVLMPFVPPPVISHYATVASHGYNANQLVIDEHTGTHMDGPAHLVDGAGVFTNEIPPQKLIATLAVVDVRARAATDPDTTLTVDDITQYEHKHGKIPTGSFVLMNSGWASRVPTPGAYINRDEAGTPRFPGLSAEAVQFLVSRRKVVGAGVDTPSLDAGVNLVSPQAHRALLGGSRYGLENVNHLGGIPAAGALVVIGLMKHAPGFGGPVRMLVLR